jgi:GNAT superfamily N-acetyltransferase
MSKALTIPKLAEFNVRVNFGSYEDGWDEIAPGVMYVSSEHISDSNCNLGYRRDCKTPTDEEIKAIEKIAASKSREPAIWQTTGQKIPEGYHSSEPRVWMLADTSVQPSEVTVPGAHMHIYSPLPTADMVKVFDQVYCQGQGDVGFNSIARHYLHVFENIAPNPPAKAFHIGVDIDGLTVAISNVNMIGDMAGLYSVAVLPEYRRRGLGRLVAVEGIKLAAKEGATHIMLRTTPQTPMQTLYESVGFKPFFEDELLIKD